MFNNGVRILFALALIATITVTSPHGVALAQDGTAVAAEEAAPAAGQNAEEEKAQQPEPPGDPDAAPQEEAGAVKEKEESGPAPVVRRGSLLWDKVLSVVGLHEEKPFKPDQVAGAPGGPAQDYVIGPGDQLGISVWRDDALTRSVVVLPDGKFHFPLVGEVVAGGKTVNQLKKELEEKLAGYVVDAGLSVEVRQSGSLFIYLIGKVNSPGRQMLLSHTNVLQALATAGGLNPFADKDDIRIFRQEGDRTLIYPFRYSLVSAGSNLEENIWLKRGDVIVVP